VARAVAGAAVVTPKDLDSPIERLPVEQRHRDAAAALMEAQGNWAYNVPPVIREGRLDENSLVQAFARFEADALTQLQSDLDKAREALGKLLALVDRMDVASWLVTEHPSEWANAGDYVADARSVLGDLT
jgi:hypothetical protein